MTCAEIRELTPELALGALSGQERDDALRHIDACDGCRAELEAFARVGDELLRVAPPAEPPSGFEERVLAQMRPAPAKSPRTWMLAAAAIVALIVGAASVFVAGAHDRDQAREYRVALGTLHGTSLHTAALRDASGRVLGEAVAYDGHPSWVFVAVERGGATGNMTIRLVGASSRAVDGLHLVNGRGALGSVVPGDINDVHTIEVVDSAAHVMMRATFERHT
jgi:predicted anti-sigma-YlaC factor YlaD